MKKIVSFYDLNLNQIHSQIKLYISKIIKSYIAPAQPKSDAPDTDCVSHKTPVSVVKTATFTDLTPSCDDLNAKSI